MSWWSPCSWRPPSQRTLPRQIFAGVSENISPTITAAAVILLLVSVILMAVMELLRRPGRADAHSQGSLTMASFDATLLPPGGTIIAFDGTEHRVLQDGVVVINGDRILHVGQGWQGRAAETIDTAGRLIIPGQISTHAHVGTHEGPRALIDAGDRRFVRSGFLHFLPTSRDGYPGFGAQADGRAALRYGFATLLRHGVTTVLAYAPGGADGGAAMLEVAAEFGIRLVWSPIISGGRYWRESDDRVICEIDEAAGLQQLEAALRFSADLPAGGLVTGAVVLDEYYVSTPTLRREAKVAAAAAGLPFTMHFLEQHREFFETMARTGRTPVQLLADEGVLDPGTILAHCIYHAGHSLVGFPMEDDIGLMGQAGVTVAHSPLAFSRRGVALESFDRYRRAGVAMALGTDTYPLDMFSEMRTGSVMGKLVEKNYEAAPAGALFAASNLGGAAALGAHGSGPDRAWSQGRHRRHRSAHRQLRHQPRSDPRPGAFGHTGHD